MSCSRPSIIMLILGTSRWSSRYCRWPPGSIPSRASGSLTRWVPAAATINLSHRHWAGPSIWGPLNWGPRIGWDPRTPLMVQCYQVSKICFLCAGVWRFPSSVKFWSRRFQKQKYPFYKCFLCYYVLKEFEKYNETERFYRIK